MPKRTPRRKAFPVDGTDISVRDLDLPPGYHAERDEAGTHLVDPEGRRVMRLPRFVPSEVRSEEPEEQDALRGALLIRLSEQIAECERLRDHVAMLEERLEAVEAERDQANAIAESMYDFFRRRMRDVVDRKRKSGRWKAR